MKVRRSKMQFDLRFSWKRKDVNKIDRFILVTKKRNSRNKWTNGRILSNSNVNISTILWLFVSDHCNESHFIHCLQLSSFDYISNEYYSFIGFTYSYKHFVFVWKLSTILLQQFTYFDIICQMEKCEIFNWKFLRCWNKVRVRANKMNQRDVQYI